MRMMKWFHAGLFGTLLVAGGVAVAESGAKGDQAFVTEALATNRLELALGRLAIERAVTPAVQEMGKKMVQKHTEHGQKLDERAAALGIHAPAELSPTDKTTLARLAALPGAELDATFKQTVDDIHRRELALYEAEARSATSPELRAFVESRVTALRANLVDRRPARPAKDW
jgi:putative membrane protein